MAAPELLTETATGGPVSPLTYMGLAAGLLQGLGGLFGDEEEPKVLPQDVFNMQRTRLIPETQAESQLARLQQQLARSVMGFSGDMPPELGMSMLARGELTPTSERRMDDLAYGNIRAAMSKAMEQATAAGMPMSSAMLAGANPMMRQGSQLRGQLEMMELDRLSKLRSQMLANAMAAQQSPALTRLLQIRLAQPETSGMSSQRPGGGLPQWQRQMAGAPQVPNWREKQGRAYGMAEDIQERMWG